MADKRPAKGQCRYRLAVVETQRDQATRKPRARVVLYLGVIDEVALNPYFIKPPEAALINRYALLAKLNQRLAQALSAGVPSQAQRDEMWGAIAQAFPDLPPPNGRSMVVIPPRVRAKALAQLERDVQATWKRVTESAADERVLDLMRQELRRKRATDAKATSANKPDADEVKQRERLRQVRQVMVGTFGKDAKEQFWKFCAEQSVPPERRDAVWQG
jgi:hypothetical protein